MRVDFYLYATHEVATAAPVLTTLRGWGVDAAFVLEPPDRHLAVGSVPDPGRAWFDDKSTRLRPLVDDELHTTLRELVATTSVPLLHEPRRDASAAMTTQGRNWLRRYDCARVRLSYGIGLVESSYGHGEVNRGFDLVLAHGRRSVDAIARTAPATVAVPVGYPKWAGYLRGECPSDAARARLGLAEDRPTLLYAPTWAHRSSVEAVANLLDELREEWQVVVKPHHNSLHLEPGRLDALLDLVPSTDLWARHDLVSYVAAADVVIADAVSGAFTEALLADRPVVGLATGIESVHPAAYECAPVLTDVRDLPRVLDDVPRARDRARAHDWVPAWFEQSGGHDDERAASATLECTISRAARLRRWTQNHARDVSRRIVRRTPRHSLHEMTEQTQ